MKALLLAGSAAAAMLVASPDAKADRYYSGHGHGGVHVDVQYRSGGSGYYAGTPKGWYYDYAYRKEDGVWRFSKTGYKRVINQILDRSQMPYTITAPDWAAAKKA